MLRRFECRVLSALHALSEGGCMRFGKPVLGCEGRGNEHRSSVTLLTGLRTGDCYRFATASAASQVKARKRGWVTEWLSLIVHLRCDIAAEAALLSPVTSSVIALTLLTPGTTLGRFRK